MSTTTDRDTARRTGGSVDQRLARLLDGPFLARVVPHLAPETLHRLVQHCGLDACAGLVTSATPAQLTSVLDLDLWRHAQPGRDEQFDVDRFGEWLEVLVDTGESVAARTVAALDEHLVVTGLSRYLRVFDPGTFEPTESSDDEPMDRRDMMTSETSADFAECEVGGYLLRSRRPDTWDAIVTLLVALEAEHPRYFQSVMQGCRSLSNSTPEIDGLDELLTAPEQHLHDAAIERERRRSRRGYATPADARAFLQVARQAHHVPPAVNTSSASASAAASAPRATPAPTAPRPTHPVVTAYFRAAEEEADGAPERAASRETNVAARENDEVRTSIDAVLELLAEAGMTPERPRALLGAGETDARAGRVPLLQRLMESVQDHDETAYLTRSRELAFLANALFAGSSVQSRQFTPQEASDAAACICNLGLECWPGRWPGAASRGGSPRTADVPRLPDTFLVDHDLVLPFEVGWSVLYQDVSLFAADQLISTLADLRCVDADTRRGVRALQRELLKQREAGTPWLARDAAEVLALLDTTAWVGVLGLLDECPVVPAALTAVLERRTTSVSPTAFQFISTPGQIGDIRLFLRVLPGLLSR
jgi:hypothetical protein